MSDITTIEGIAGEALEVGVSIAPGDDGRWYVSDDRRGFVLIPAQEGDAILVVTQNWGVITFSADELPEVYAKPEPVSEWDRWVADQIIRRMRGE